ncbi:MAG TPA: hypothetical protein VME68_01610 [Acidobacteriaceae bacterium]|nr:hypothetical protein [Acidobacteriaceae bacterium]
MNRNDDQLRQGLRGYSAQIAATHTPPPAAGIWLMAERRRRRRALERATLPLRIMQGVGLACAIAVAVWLLVDSGAHGAGLLRDVQTLGVPGAVMACGSVLLVVAGCWAMLAAERRVAR